MKKVKCEQCTELLSAGNMDKSSVIIDSADTRQEFLAQISRGGLLKPSDVVYITCMHAFVLYNTIKMNSESFSLLLTSPNPRSVFTTYFSNLIEESNCVTSIMTTACRGGHKFQIYVRKLTDILFNLMAKNYVSELNSSIHANKKGLLLQVTVKHPKIKQARNEKSKN